MLFKSSLTKEVSPWLSLSVKCPRPAAISAVAPTGSCLLPALRFAPSAANPLCPTELARLAATTTVVRSWLPRLSNSPSKSAEMQRKASCLPLFPFLGRLFPNSTKTIVIFCELHQIPIAFAGNLCHNKFNILYYERKCFHG